MQLRLREGRTKTTVEVDSAGALLAAVVDFMTGHEPIDRRVVIEAQEGNLGDWRVAGQAPRKLDEFGCLAQPCEGLSEALDEEVGRAWQRALRIESF